MVSFYSCYNEAGCKGYYYVAGFFSWFRLLSIIGYCGHQSHKPTSKLYLVSFFISLLSIFGEISQAGCMLFATDTVFVTDTWLRKGRSWTGLWWKFMPKRGLLSNFRLIVLEGEIEPEVPANIYLFICLDGWWELV